MALFENKRMYLNESTNYCPKYGQATNRNNQEQTKLLQQEAHQPLSMKSEGLFHRWLIVIVVLCLAACGFNNLSDDLEKEVKTVMVKQCKEKGYNLVVKDLILVKEDNTHYSGIAKCTLDGDPLDLDVNVVTDGRKFVAEWAPTDEYLIDGLDELWYNELWDN